MQTPNIGETATAIVGLLTPLNSEERHRVVHAAMTLLGEAAVSAGSATAQNRNEPALPSRTQAWLRQNGLTQEQLETVFQIENDAVELIAATVPGHNDKERTLNVYVLTGVARFIATGDASFDDKSARKACKDLGCYNEANHSSYVKDKGNKMAGSKEAGWKLTGPGLSQGAALIKDVARSSGVGSSSSI